jgi:uncharacterized protein YkwD
VTWATKKTSEMPALQLPGRHRRSPGTIGLLAGGALLILLLGAAVLSPLLLTAIGQNAGRANSSGVPAPVPSTDDLVLPGHPMPTAAPSPSRSPSPSAVPTTTRRAPRPLTMVDLENGVLAATNAARFKAHCDPLRLNSKLRAAAESHTTDMATKGYFDHIGSDGSDPPTRMRRAGYDPNMGWAENIAWGYPTVQAVMSGWMNSAGHRANILNCSLHSIGIGAARASNGALYWTQDFGSL